MHAVIFDPQTGFIEQISTANPEDIASLCAFRNRSAIEVPDDQEPYDRTHRVDAGLLVRTHWIVDGVAVPVEQQP